MKRLRVIIAVFLLACLWLGCGEIMARKVSKEDKRIGVAQRELADLCSSYPDCRIGVAVVSDRGKTFGIAMDESFPMFSVVKFPVAMTVAEVQRLMGKDFSERIVVEDSLLSRDTWSPMLKDLTTDDLHEFTLLQLLEYALGQSDNNALDILARGVGGMSMVTKYMRILGLPQVSATWNEKDMNENPLRALENTTTPLALASLLRRFQLDYNDPLSMQIKTIMENCTTGQDKLPAGLPPGAVLGHKTGSGPEINGRIMASNDVGMVTLPSGKRYCIAVFIADSGYDSTTNSMLIAKIGEIASGAFK